MNIRAATENDANIVREMGNKVLAHHATFNPFYKPVTASENIPAPLEILTYLAINDSDKVIGYIKGVFNNEPLDRSYPYAVIQSIWVEEAARGQGAAQSLVRTFEEAVKEKGAKQIDLFVDLQNSLGLTLWDKAGYVTYQEKRRKLI